MSHQMPLQSARQIGEIQHRAARAVPAAAQDYREGCWLRYGDSEATWWAGAVLMHGSRQSPGLRTSIATAEDFYAARRAPARFQVCPACPADLDEELSRRRYAVKSVISLQVATAECMAAQPSAPSLQVDISEELTDEWFQLMLMAGHGQVADPAPEWRLQQRVNALSAYATASISGQQVAAGRAVADTGWVGMFNMTTLPHARRRGAASAVLAALADWAISQGCPQMYLQVERDNTAALRLYRHAGFEELCTYHYRVQDWETSIDVRRIRMRVTT